MYTGRFKKKHPFDYRQTAGFYFSSHTKVQGDLHESEDIVIDGTFMGNLSTDGFCEISENGYLHGDIEARSLTIFGKLAGNATAINQVVVKKSATVRGYVRTPQIEIEPGADVEVRIKRVNHQSSESEAAS